MKSNKRGFGDTNLGLAPYNYNPDIGDSITQTLTRVLGWDYLNEYWRELTTDTDGRLLVSTEPTKGTLATQSNIEVSTSSTSIVGANTDRKSIAIQNIGTDNVYIQLGAIATVANSFPLPPDGIFSTNDYVGAISAIVDTGTQDVRIIEVE